MNLFRNHFLKFTDCHFDRLSQLRFVQFQPPRFAGAFEIDLTRHLKFQIFNFRRVIFPFVKVVTRIGKQWRLLRQIKDQFRQAPQVRAASRQHIKFGRKTVAGYRQLHFYAVEMLPPTRHFAARLFILDKPAKFEAINCRRPPPETNRANSALARAYFSRHRRACETGNGSSPSNDSRNAKI